MPGIVGIISSRPAGECQSLVRAMIGSMEHERFYTSGTYFVPELGIYAGWVALKDSFTARQVFFNEQKDIALIFSGECFADPQIQRDLKQKGHRIEKNNDWLVHLYEEEGDQFFEILNGLFSGLLIDKRRRKAFLFNDRYGVERIYWHQATDALYFASEAKALLRILPKLREFDLEGVAQFLNYGCTLEGRTLFRDIHLLPGGSLWSSENGRCHKKTYFSAATWELQPTLSTDSFESEFEEIFKRILPRYFESESKIGISLTGGLDTRMIMACRPKTEKKPVCYNFSGEKGLTFDDRLAARVAETCGLEHRLLRLGSDFFSDFATHADQTVYITDGCLGIIGTHEVYLNRQVHHLAPVRITGNYGSEVLRGVSTFKPLRLSPRLVSRDFSRVASFSAQEFLHDGQHPVTFAAFREIPWKRFGVLAAGRSQTIFRTPYLDNELVALAYQAPAESRQSRGPALRLVKNSSVDLGNIPTDKGDLGVTGELAVVLRRCFSKATFKLDYLYNEGLPHWLSCLDPLFRTLNSRSVFLGLHKFLHYRNWFRQELGAYVNEILADMRTRRSQFWNPGSLERMAREHIAGRRNYVAEINAALTLEAVERLLFRELPR
jgi:asparagine synthase (glutamine-hydrolysing)